MTFLFLDKILYEYSFHRHTQAPDVSVLHKKYKKDQILTDARVFTQTKRMKHIIPFLRILRVFCLWFSVSKMDFKILLLVNEALDGLGPKYFSDLLLCLLSPNNNMEKQCSVLCSTYLDETPTLNSFNLRLKTFLFDAFYEINFGTNSFISLFKTKWCLFLYCPVFL